MDLLAQLPSEVLGLALRFEIDRKSGAVAMHERKGALRSVCKRWDDAVQQACSDEAYALDRRQLKRMWKSLVRDGSDRRNTLRFLFIEVVSSALFEEAKQQAVRDWDRTAQIISACSRLAGFSYDVRGILTDPFYRRRDMPMLTSGRDHQAVKEALAGRNSLQTIEVAEDSIDIDMLCARQLFQTNPRLRRIATSHWTIERTFEGQNGPTWSCRGLENLFLDTFASQSLVNLAIDGCNLNLDLFSDRCKHLRSLRIIYDSRPTSKRRGQAAGGSAHDLSSSLASFAHLDAIRIDISFTDRVFLGDALSAVLGSTASTLELRGPAFIWHDLPLSNYKNRLAASIMQDKPRSFRLGMFDRSRLASTSDRNAAWSKKQRQEATDLAAAYNIALCFLD